MRMCGKYYHLECVRKNPRTQFFNALEVPDGVVESTPASSSSVLPSALAAATATVALRTADASASTHGAAQPPDSANGLSTGPRLLTPGIDPPGLTPHFVCPFHVCATCNQPFDAFHPSIYYRCHACPNSYHRPVS
jgi:hypothetical protein